MIIKTILGKKMLCLAIGTAVVAPPVIVHKIDRHVAKVEKRVAVRQAVAKVRRERPAFHAKREAIVATDFHAPPVIAEAAATCVSSGGPSGGGFAGGGGGSGGFIGIGGGAIGIGNTPAPGGVITPPIPEPSGWTMMILGIGTIGGNMRRARTSKRKAGGTIQADREFAAGWIVIGQPNAIKIRAGEWDDHPAVVAATAHRMKGPGRE